MEVALFYFCKKQGPTLIKSVPSSLSAKDEEFAIKIFDIAPVNKFFQNSILEEANKKLVSYSFELKQAGSRGGVEMFMISVFYNELIDLEFICNNMRMFVDKMRKIEDVQELCEQENCSERKFVHTHLFELYQTLVQRIERTGFIDKIFSQKSKEDLTKRDVYLNVFVRTLINSIDARTPQGATTLYDVGKVLASRFSDLFNSNNINDLIVELKKFWKEMKLGEIDEFNKSEDVISFKVYECFECSHLPNIGQTVCKFDEGFLKNILELKLQIPLYVKEMECVATGKHYCLFNVKSANDPTEIRFICD